MPYFIFLQIYGTLTLGLSMVGYMMMCYGTCQLATLLVVEKLHLRLKPMVAILNGSYLEYNNTVKYLIFAAPKLGD